MYRVGCGCWGICRRYCREQEGCIEHADVWDSGRAVKSLAFCWLPRKVWPQIFGVPKAPKNILDLTAFHLGRQNKQRPNCHHSLQQAETSLLLPEEMSKGAEAVTGQMDCSYCSCHDYYFIVVIIIAAASFIFIITTLIVPLLVMPAILPCCCSFAQHLYPARFLFASRPAWCARAKSSLQRIPCVTGQHFPQFGNVETWMATSTPATLNPKS